MGVKSSLPQKQSDLIMRIWFRIHEFEGEDFSLSKVCYEIKRDLLKIYDNIQIK